MLKECKGIPPSEAINMTYAQVCFAMKGIEQATAAQEIELRDQRVAKMNDFARQVSHYKTVMKYRGIS